MFIFKIYIYLFTQFVHPLTPNISEQFSQKQENHATINENADSKDGKTQPQEKNIHTAEESTSILFKGLSKEPDLHGLLQCQ